MYKNYNSIQTLNFLILTSIGLLLLGSGCTASKKLAPGETFLEANSIAFKNADHIKNKRNLSYELTTIYKQRPNQKFFFLPLYPNRYIYYNHSRPQDTTKWDAIMRGTFAEQPAIYREKLSASTAQTMEYYLHNKGYFEAKVNYVQKTKKKKTTVKYIVEPRSLYVIDSIEFTTRDSNLQLILNDIAEESFLKKGKAVSESTFNKESVRITNIFKNLGYAYFDVNFIEPVGIYDTVKHTVDVIFDIKLPKNKDQHLIYKIGDIDINPKYDPATILQLRDTMIRGFNFKLGDEISLLKPSTIARAIQVESGQLYNQDDLESTKKQLGNLEIYRFASVRFEPRENDPTILDFNIQLTPRKKNVAGFDVEVNNSSFNTTNTRVSQLGTGFNLNYKNRNILRQAITLNSNINTSVEWQFGNALNSIYLFNLSPSVDIFIPKFTDLNGIWTLADKFGFLPPKFNRKLRDNAKTRVSLNYSRVIINQFYNYNSFNGAVGYDLELSSTNRMRLNTVGLNLLLPEFDQLGQDLIANNRFLELSFDNQLFTGFFFRDLTFTHAGKQKFGRSWFFRADFEVSGLEVLAINDIYNALSNNSDQFRLNNTLDFEQYFKLDLTLNHSWQLQPDLQLAHRINVGIARPYGPFSETVPYVKQFSVGGPFSNRGWRLRELGPGGYYDSLTVNADSLVFFFQAGDFKIEFNHEWRFALFSIFKGAYFVDIGNVWTLKEDNRGPEAVLGKNFLQQMAIGTGVGLRIDASYFVLRFDFGWKVRKPYLIPNDPDDGYWLVDDIIRRPFRGVNVNFALGYAF